MFKIGDNVKILNSNLYGTILNIKKSKEKYNYYIKCNDKILNINENLLELQNTDKINKKSYTNSRNITISLNNSNEFKPEIMLRHENVDIAIYNLDNFINEAIFMGVHNVKIIHGKNGGILRKAVHEYLKSNKNIVEFHLGNYYEGQFGVTIATLK